MSGKKKEEKKCITCGKYIARQYSEWHECSLFHCPVRKHVTANATPVRFDRDVGAFKFDATKKD